MCIDRSYIVYNEKEVAMRHKNHITLRIQKHFLNSILQIVYEQ